MICGYTMNDIQFNEDIRYKNVSKNWIAEYCSPLLKKSIKRSTNKCKFELLSIHVYDENCM